MLRVGRAAAATRVAGARALCANGSERQWPRLLSASVCTCVTGTRVSIAGARCSHTTLADAAAAAAVCVSQAVAVVVAALAVRVARAGSTALAAAALGIA